MSTKVYNNISPSYKTIAKDISDGFEVACVGRSGLVDTLFVVSGSILYGLGGLAFSTPNFNIVFPGDVIPCVLGPINLTKDVKADVYALETLASQYEYVSPD